MKIAIYCRKSSEDDKRQILSLPAQISWGEKIATEESWEYEIIQESKSAKEPGRPEFNRMMKRFERGELNGILCWKIDRLTRNPIDGGTIQYLLQKGIIKFIKTSEKTFYPQDNVLLLNIEQGMANQYIRDLSTNVKRGNREKLAQGGWPHKAPLGYLNSKGSLEIDKKFAPFVKRTFNLYAEEKLTLKQIAEALFKEGLRTKSGNKVTKSQIHKILNNRLYSGYTEDNEGVIRKGNHKAIVSLETFNLAQELLQNKSHPHPKKYFYSAQGFLQCASCGCAITVDTQKGYQYYYCTNGKGVCTQNKKYMRSEDIDVLLSGVFKELEIDEELIEISTEAYKSKNLEKNYYLNNSLASLEEELNLLLQRELSLTDGFSSGIVREEIYKLKIKEIGNKRIEIQHQIKNIKNSTTSEVTLEQIKKVFLDCNLAAKTYLVAEDEEKRKMLKTMLSNATIHNQKVVSYQFLNLYSLIAKSGKNRNLEVMLGDRDSNPGTQDQNLMSYR
jgi:site-specific DNA recombinase